ncbi:hypothetical protein CEP52_005827 [Fusarium oligoseptatum]|uniref:Amidohydrolase-related domain-containing protein n=1 Tax=Fusarium oligoseptatum TaxID=2604345 RepID=A0A428TW40_9HYPO|nr:hypothetical protein CEP52_005827 [Fusarium oligoseptatum]
MHHPVLTSIELELCVRGLGFVEVLAHTHLPDGTYYDTPRFHPVFKTEQKLDVPIYFHPTFSNPEVKKVPPHDGFYPRDVEMALSGWCAAFHCESGLHILRLFATSMFGKFPRLKIMIGHADKLLPYMPERNLEYSSRCSKASSRKRDLRQVWDQNTWYQQALLSNYPS